MVAGGAAPTGPVPRIPELMLLASNKGMYERRHHAYRVNVATKHYKIDESYKTLSAP